MRLREVDGGLDAGGGEGLGQGGDSEIRVEHTVSRNSLPNGA
jgi:hypothetical protein